MIKKILIGIVGLIFVAFIILQFFRIDQSNPPINPAETLEAAVTVPDNVEAVLARSCNDCHSNKTVYPWYANIQPSGWFLKSHIDDGKRHLNFSIFKTYPISKQAKKLDEVCEQVELGEMPLPSYLWIHRSSILTKEDGKLLCDWAKSEMTKLKTE